MVFVTPSSLRTKSVRIDPFFTKGSFAILVVVCAHGANMLPNTDKNRYGIRRQVRLQLRYESLPVELVRRCTQNNRGASSTPVMMGKFYAVDTCLKDAGEFSHGEGHLGGAPKAYVNSIDE